MKNVAEISQRKCTGCGACTSVCPESCIEMVENRRGFLCPVIDESVCNDCGLCLKKCPVQSNYQPNNLLEQPLVYAAWNRNDLIREKSSSGGIFSLFSAKILQNNGVVCGAGFDNNFELHHIIVDTEEEMNTLRGSKYLQSNTTLVFKRIKYLLKEGKSLLFVGTPCQVAGLNHYLSRPYSQLLTCDLVCHGVPSTKVFLKYLKEIEAKQKSKVTGVDFRNKRKGWKRYSIVVHFNSGKKISSVFTFNRFMKGFLQNLYLRSSCYECPYATIPRVGDITLGDFWKIGSKRPDLDDDKGTSLILINTGKGRLLFDSISSNDCFREEVDIALSLPGNRTLTRPTFVNSRREEFFTEIDSENFHSLIRKYYGISLVKDYVKHAVLKFMGKH